MLRIRWATACLSENDSRTPRLKTTSLSSAGTLGTTVWVFSHRINEGAANIGGRHIIDRRPTYRWHDWIIHDRLVQLIEIGELHSRPNRERWL